MREMKLADLRVRIVGGTDGNGGGDGPVVVLLHGFGAPGDDLVPLARAIGAPKGTRFVFPEAPTALGGPYGMGRAWWLIDMMRFQEMAMSGVWSDLTQSIPAELPEMRGRVAALLHTIVKEWNVPWKKIVLGGFSQGAMLSFDTVLQGLEDISLGGLVLLSTTLIAEDEWLPKIGQLKGFPIFQSHGDSDPILPFEIAERLREELIRAGADLTWVKFRGGHGVSPEVGEGLGNFLRKVLA